jgi:hypothetical protein
MGGKGSGQSRRATNAVEELIAAVFRDDKREVLVQRNALAEEHSLGTSNMSSVELESIAKKVVKHLAWDVQGAEANPKDGLGDIKVLLTDGQERWIEVKAQTKKQNFSDITQADYIRDSTDFLQALYGENREFAKSVPRNLARQLEFDRPKSSVLNWSLEDQWIADLALLVNSSKKAAAGVASPATLRVFIQKKYFLQICMAGARLVRMDRLAPVDAMLSGAKLKAHVKLTNRANKVSVQLAAGKEPVTGTTEFTYHLGYVGALGRHKLHNVSISSSRDVYQINLRRSDRV